MPDSASDGPPSVPSMREHAERANRIASSQEQLLHAQLQQLGLDTGDDASLEPTPDALLPPRHADEPGAWGAPHWGPTSLAGASPWGPPPPAPSSAAAPPLASVPYHRRGASDLGGFRFPSSQPSQRGGGMPPDATHTRSPSSYAPPLGAPASAAVEQQRQAIQHQIKELQRQQQQLLRQQQLMHTATPAAPPPLGALHEDMRGARTASAPHHRRIQSQSATSMPHGALATPLEANRWPSHAPFANDARGMRANANFSFPPRRTPSDKPAGGGGARAEGAPRSPQTTGRHAGHTRHASYQLASELSPEYLIAAGGMLSGSTLALAGVGGGAGGAAGGNDLADGFADAPAHRRHPQHARSTSLSSAPLVGAAASGGDVMANLGQAQAQLAALHRSRQQAGPGTHARSASYSGARSASHGGGGNGPGGAAGGGSGGGGPRKALFGSYLPQSSLAPLLLTGKLVVGVLRVNKRNRSDAWVTTEVLDQDIFISGSKDRNRALEGDLVAVELLDPHEVWQTKRDKVDKKKRKEEHAAHQRTPSNAGATATATAGRRLDKARDDAEVEGAQLKLIEDEEESDAAPPALAGHVVAIVERVAGQLFPGTLALLRPSSVATKEKQAQQAQHAQHAPPPHDEDREATPRPKIVWFRPSDKRVPLIAIPADQAPDDFWDEARQEQYGHTLFLACIKRWPITSLHPFGTLVDTLGPIGDLHAEREALVRSHCGALATDFPEAARKAAPAPGWSVPPSEYARATFGATAQAGAAGAAPNACVLAVAGDDNDDDDDAPVHVALSVEALDDGAVAIGVHIADAAYFVRPNTALDREAKRRAEAAALVGHTYPMLPGGVAHAAAFLPGEDRLAVSTVTVVSPGNEVRDVRITRSVVHVAHRLTPAALATELATPATLPPAAPRLAALAHALRARRAAAGAVDVAEPTLHVALRPDGYPAHAAAHPSHSEAAACVHELLVHANTAAALRVAAAHPTSALLVRADAPTEKALHTLHTQLAALGGAREAAAALAAAPLTLAALPHVLATLPPHARAVADALTAKALPAARFFCTGMVDVSKFAHRWLPAAVYTDAAAPLAQYAQLCVQRQLLAALGEERAVELDAEAVAKLAQQANARHKAVRVAEEQSAHLYLCALLARDGAQRHTATVMGVGEAHVDVLVAALAVEKRVHLDQLPVRITAARAPHAVSLTWDATRATQTLAPLADVQVDVHADMDKSPPVLTVSLVAPAAAAP